MTTAGPLVCVVTDRRRVTAADESEAGWRAYERWLDDVVDARPDLVQLRERDLDAAALAALVRRLAARAAGTPTTIIVNDRADVALAAGAAGVHVRADGPRAARVRTIAPDGWTIGRSVHLVSEVAAHQDADYLLYGTVFATRSKPAGAPLAGLDGLRQASEASEKPVLAIGGLTVERASAAVANGAAGVAAIGLFLPAGVEPGALGPARAVAALRAAMLQ